MKLLVLSTTWYPSEITYRFHMFPLCWQLAFLEMLTNPIRSPLIPCQMKKEKADQQLESALGRLVCHGCYQDIGGWVVGYKSWWYSHYAGFHTFSASGHDTTVTVIAAETAKARKTKSSKRCHLGRDGSKSQVFLSLISATGRLFALLG